MSGVFHPLHPAIILLQKKLAKQFHSTVAITFPAGSTLQFSIAPPAGWFWAVHRISYGTPRDVATNNPVITSNCYAIHEQVGDEPMIRQFISPLQESVYNFSCLMAVDITLTTPFQITLINNTALNILIDLSIAVIEMPDSVMRLYYRLWDGLYNLEHVLGTLEEGDAEGIRRQLIGRR